jgi:hypothetical protein
MQLNVDPMLNLFKTARHSWPHISRFVLEAYETQGRMVLCCWSLESDCLVCLGSRGVHFGAHFANDAATRELTRVEDNLP